MKEHVRGHRLMATSRDLRELEKKERIEHYAVQRERGHANSFRMQRGLCLHRGSEGVLGVLRVR